MRHEADGVKLVPVAQRLRVVYQTDGGEPWPSSVSDETVIEIDSSTVAMQGTRSGQKWPQL
jgi:hypothetical protein